MRIEGTVSPGFESVKALYERNMRTLAERNTQLCVYVGEECVVDLWGSAVGDDAFGADSLANVFSSGKSLESIALASLADRGLLNFDAPIAEYWPEFAANGKAAITVADLMRHEAGLAAFDVSVPPSALHPDNIVQNALGEVIEQHEARFREGAGNQREYHAITRGWIANEVFRRVEPQGRTMGAYLREEVTGPLGADVFVGLPQAEMHRLSGVQMLGAGYQIAQGFLPRAMGRKMELNIAQMVAKVWRLRSGLTGRSRARPPAPIEGMRKLSFVDSPEVSIGETPSACSKGSARGLARLGAAMANGGQFAGQTVLGEAGLAALHANPVKRNMLALTTDFTQSGLARFEPLDHSAPALDRAFYQGREGFYGWMGLGGSIFQWHPELKIGFGYVPTSLNVLDIVNERGKAYQAEVLRCLS